MEVEQKLTNGLHQSKVEGVVASIVTFNPDVDLLKKNIRSIENQVEEVIVVDNNSENIKAIECLVSKLSNTYIIKNKNNEGIAYALNQACEYAYAKGFKWNLTLDQDSICNQNFVSCLYNISKSIINPGIVAPIIIDRNVGVIGHAPSDELEYKEVRTCITSGALTNLLAWNTINGFDNKMFIDSVDFDFCYRLRKNNFKVVQCPNVKLNHSIGDAKRLRFLFFHFNNTEHSAFRDFYIAQNSIYYPKKNRMVLRLIRGNFRNIKLILVVLIYEKNKVEKINSIVRGWKNGYKL